MVAASSREVIFNMSVAVSTELRAIYNEAVQKGDYGYHGLSCFSPVINIMRHPLWGRNQVQEKANVLSVRQKRRLEK